MASYQSIISTRARNKQVHPGQVIIESSQHRRSTEEVTKARVERQRQINEKNQLEAERVQRILSIQDQLAEEDRERSRPTPTSSTWPPPYSATIRPPHVPGQRSSVIRTIPSNSNHNNDDDDDNYEPDPNEGESEKDDSSESEEEAEIVVPPAGKPGQMKKKQKVNRAAIAAAASTQPSIHQPAPPVQPPTAVATKRKGASEIAASTANKKSRPNPTGSQTPTTSLLPGWNHQHSHPVPTVSSALQPDNDDDSMVHPGGFVGDNEHDNIERPSVAAGVSSKKMPSMIKISAPKPAQVPTKKQKRGRAAKWNLTHLPDADVAREFTNILVPAARCKIGTLPAWNSLSASQVQELVDAVYPERKSESEFIVDEDGPWMGLLGYRMSNWRNGFVQHAQDAVSTFIASEKNKDPDLSVSELVAHYITPRGNPPARPFEYREWSVDPATLKISKRGRLQNEMVMTTLAKAHFAEFDTISDPSSLSRDDLPRGALVLALQAVEHVLKSWETGEYQHDGTPASFFSADNYADKMTMKLVNGQQVRTLVPVAGRYRMAIDTLSTSHWQNIFVEVAGILDSFEKRSKKKRAQSASSEANSDYVVDESNLIMVSSDD